MQTHLSQSYLDSEEGHLANKILRSCVHCGFCSATCPTYQVLGDELDSPRGRIYQVKQMLEEHQFSLETVKHLDQCLTCRSCETTCPSGVEYSKLLDIGREYAEKKLKRPLRQRLMRKILLAVLPYPWRFRRLLKIGQVLRPVLPGFIKKKIPAPVKLEQLQLSAGKKHYLILEGCVQPSLSPGINHATRKVLNALSIEVISFNGCCGAIQHHLADNENALNTIRHNIDSLLEEFKNGIDGIVITASGCGAMIKDYPHLLRNDPEYHDRAIEVVNKTKDISELVNPEKIADSIKPGEKTKIAIHTPCTLQHALKLPDQVEKIFQACGFTLVPVVDKHLCCGSAGTYSLLQPKLANTLRAQRLAGLEKNQPDLIVTANIGCLHHLAEESQVPVRHWIEIIADHL